MTHEDERPTVRILGTHGVPAGYGGFETAAENVALYLRDQGWRVVVYCQQQGRGPVTEDVWNGIERVHIPIERDGWLGTSHFDLVSIRHAVRHRDVCLTFGYNTAVFNVLQRLRGIPQRHQHGRHRVVAARGGDRSSSRSCGRTSASPASWATSSSPTIRRSSATCGRGRGRRRSRRSPTGRTPSTSAPTAAVEELGLRPGSVPHADLPADPGELDPRAGPGLLGPPPRHEAGGARYVHRGRSLSPGRHGRGERRGASSSARSTTRRAVAALRFHSRRLPPRPHRRRHEPVARRGAGGRQPGRRPRQRVQPLGRRRRGRLLHDVRRRRRMHHRGARRSVTPRRDGRGQPGSVTPRSSHGNTSPVSTRRCFAALP